MKYIKNRKALSEHGKIMDGEDALIDTARTIAKETNDGRYEKLIDLQRAADPESQILREHVAHFLNKSGKKGRPKKEPPIWDVMDIYWRVRELQVTQNISPNAAFSIVDNQIHKARAAKSLFEKGKELREGPIRKLFRDHYSRRLEQVLVLHASNGKQIEFELYLIEVEGWLEDLTNMASKLKAAAKEATGHHLRELAFQITHTEIGIEELRHYIDNLKHAS